MGSEWSTKRLGDVITLKRGYDLPTRLREPGNVPIVSSSGISGTHSEVKVAGPGVITGRYGTIGKVFYIEESFWPLNTTLYVQDFKGNHRRFIKYLLETIDFEQFSDKAAVPGVNRNHLHEALVSLPAVGIQEQIADSIAVLEDRIQNLRRVNVTLEAIAQTLFKSWFVDFDPVRAKAEGREPEGMDATTAALFPAEFDSDNALPCGWAWVKLGDVFDVGIGKTPPRKEAQWFSQSVEDVPWVSIRDMGEAGVFLMNTAEKLTTEAVTRFNVRCVPAGTVMMSFKLTVGRVAISDGVLTTNEAIAHFKSMPESLPQSYLYCYLKSYDMDSIASTSSIATATNSKAIRGLAITHPGDPLALAFNDAVAPLFERIRMQQKQANTLSEIRDTILPRLISGELRLPDVEREVEAVTA